MSEVSIRLSDDDLWAAATGVDTVTVILDELLTRRADDLHSARDGAVRLTPWPGPAPEGSAAGRPGTDPRLVALDDLSTGTRCLLPRDGLSAVRAAALAVLAGQRFLSGRVVTAAVLGGGAWAGLQAAIIIRHLPGVSHLAMPPPARHRLADALESTGTGLNLTPCTSAAVQGANLVVIQNDSHSPLQPRQLAQGAVLVNSTSRPLAAAVTAEAQQVYLDDLSYAVPGQGRPRLRCESAHPCWQGRPQVLAGGSRLVDADLRQLVTGVHPGRVNPADVVLVELQTAGEWSAELAYQLCQAAHQHGLGQRELN